MSVRKQRLLRQYRRQKRIGLFFFLLLVACLGLLVAWWLAPLALLLGWVIHEAWFADHLFYQPDDDYRFEFPQGTPSVEVRLSGEQVVLGAALAEGDTLILEIRVRATWLGRLRDPRVFVGSDRQDFERGVDGVRFLNLSGQRALLEQGELSLRGRHCRLASQGRLHVFNHPDYAARRLLVIAPHADDAELAAFGLYRRAPDVAIVTLTQGEIEAEAYQDLGLDSAAAARLKGRLRAWDSLAIPLWGGVPHSRCWQLGYYCLRLPLMAADPERPYPSRESAEQDIRSVRRQNPALLPADANGQPTWTNLVADLCVLIERYRPEVVVTPHPELDPHSDHVAATQAVLEAINAGTWRPDTLLLYANHLHDNDRWPMGPADCGIALPPAIEPLPADSLWSPVLDAETRLDKAMALVMQHDLQGRLPFKRRLRRFIQQWLVGRRWPTTADDEFLRKAVRRHELFWVRPLFEARRDQ